MTTVRDGSGTPLNENKSAYGNPYMFTGRHYDDETDLYYYRARMYAPAIGRFLQPDPIGYADGMNLYAYCGNNPVNWIDPWGLCNKELFAPDPTRLENETFDPGAWGQYILNSARREADGIYIITDEDLRNEVRWALTYLTDTALGYADGRFKMHDKQRIFRYGSRGTFTGEEVNYVAFNAAVRERRNTIISYFAPNIVDFSYGISGARERRQLTFGQEGEVLFGRIGHRMAGDQLGKRKLDPNTWDPPRHGGSFR